MDDNSKGNKPPEILFQALVLLGGAGIFWCFAEIAGNFLVFAIPTAMIVIGSLYWQVKVSKSKT